MFPALLSKFIIELSHTLLTYQLSSLDFDFHIIYLADRIVLYDSCMQYYRAVDLPSIQAESLISQRANIRSCTNQREEWSL